MWIRGLKEKGLVRGLGLLGISNEHLEIEGRVSTLFEDPLVEPYLTPTLIQLG